MRDAEIVRDPADKGRWMIADIGSVRFPRRWKNEVVIEVPGALPWTSNGKALSKGLSEAIDNAGTVRAAFDRRAGTDRILCDDRTLEIGGGERHMTRSTSPYVVREGERELLRIDAQAWGRRPIAMAVLDETAAQDDPLLMLFAAYAVHLLCTRPRAMAVS